MVTFAQPIWIFVGLGLCLSLWFVFRFLRSRRLERLQRFGSPELLDQLTRNVSRSRRLIKNLLLLGSLFCCFLALARPQYGSRWIDVKRKGIDILFALDTSTSMLVQDLKPNRLERAKLGIMDFVSRLEGDRIGLLPFAGTGFLMCPLTMDYNAFERSLDAIDPQIIPASGTNLGRAITEAETVLNNQANHKILILITDGENLTGDAVQTAATAHDKGMTIFTVGVGTPEGELIPEGSTKGGGYKKDKEGKFITSRLDETMLTRIGEAGGGLYARLGESGQGLDTIYRKKLAMIPKKELVEKRTKVPVERFVWPLLAAFVLLILEFLLSSRKSGSPFSLPFLSRKGKKESTVILRNLLFLIAITSLVVTRSGLASPGEEAYRAGDYIGASQIYTKLLKKDPDNPQLHFNYGAAAYKNNLFDDAINSFNRALETDDLDLQARAYYNQGNALYQKGLATLQSDPEHALKAWQTALDAYASSLSLDKENKDCLFNRDLVKKKLEELQKKQQEQQKQKQQNEKQEQNKKKEKEKCDNPSSQPKQGDGQEQKKDPQGKEDHQDKTQQDGQQNDPQEQPEEDGSQQKKADQQKQDGEKQRQDAARSAAIDQQRKKEGKMTREEAEQLLNSLKNGENELNYVPSLPRPTDSTPGRDW